MKTKNNIIRPVSLAVSVEEGDFMKFSGWLNFWSDQLRSVVLLLLALAFVPALQAATLYKWVDADGNVVYQDTPPPGNVEFEESTVDSATPAVTVDTGKQIEDAALENPVSLYTVPVCDGCDLVRLLLEKKSIPFAERDVRNNQETQAELQELTGSLSVPTLIIGSTVLDGYSRTAITEALEKAGFPVIEENAETASPETVSNDTDTVVSGTAEISDGETDSTNSQ